MVYSKAGLPSEPDPLPDDFLNDPIKYIPNVNKEVHEFAKGFSRDFITLDKAILKSWTIVMAGLPYVKNDFPVVMEYLATLSKHIKSYGSFRSMKYDFGIEEVVQALKIGIALKDISLEGKPCIIGPHNRNVEFYSRAICRGIGLPRDASQRIVTAAGLHDVGKVIVPNHILEKRAGLSENEFNIIKMHPLTGQRILQRVGEIFGVDTRHIVAGIASHQEKFGGGGYPNNLAREQIPIDGQIIAVADAFDAMTSCRPYHKAKSLEEALEELSRDPRNQFSSAIVDESLEALEEAYGVVYPSMN